MTYSLADIIFLFFIYSFVGWLWETVYCSIKDKKFAYRGFLVGPYCPVYGFAVTNGFTSDRAVSEQYFMAVLEWFACSNSI